MDKKEEFDIKQWSKNIETRRSKRINEQLEHVQEVKDFLNSFFATEQGIKALSFIYGMTLQDMPSISFNESGVDAMMTVFNEGRRSLGCEIFKYINHDIMRKVEENVRRNKYGNND